MKSKLSFLAALVILITGSLVAADQQARSPETKPLIGRLRHVTVFVSDYEEALRWYTDKLGFAKVEDQAFGAGERWLVVAPPGQKDLGIVLAKSAGKDKERIGATKDWVFDADDCQKSYETLKARGVKFLKVPQKLPWGTQAIFQDLYGNEFVLLSR